MMLRQVDGFAGGKKHNSKCLVVLWLEKPLTLQVMESREPSTRYKGPVCDSVSTWAPPEGEKDRALQVPIIVPKVATLENLVLLSIFFFFPVLFFENTISRFLFIYF